MMGGRGEGLQLRENPGCNRDQEEQSHSKGGTRRQGCRGRSLPTAATVLRMTGGSVRQGLPSSSRRSLH